MAVAGRLVAEQVTSTRPVSPRRRRRLGKLVPPLSAFAVMIGVWQLVSSSLSNGRQFLLPPPLQVLEHGLLARQSLDQILPALGRTTEIALVWLVIAIAVGMAIATLLYRFSWLERAAYPYLVALQAIPALAIAPLIAVAFGYTFTAKGIIVFIIAFFPIPTNFLLGLKSVDRGLDDLFRLHRAGWFTRYFKLAFRNALPQLFAGFRISAGLAVIGAIVGEQSFQAGAPGLGMLLLQYIQYVEYDQVYACIIVSSLLGIAVYTLFTSISNRLFFWHESARVETPAPRRRAVRSPARS